MLKYWVIGGCPAQFCALGLQQLTQAPAAPVMRQQGGAVWWPALQMPMLAGKGRHCLVNAQFCSCEMRCHALPAAVTPAGGCGAAAWPR